MISSPFSLIIEYCVIILVMFQMMLKIELICEMTYVACCYFFITLVFITDYYKSACILIMQLGVWHIFLLYFGNSSKEKLLCNEDIYIIHSNLPKIHNFN